MQIEQYIEGERDVPLVIAGSSGSGKSSILAAAVNRSLLKQVLYLFPISVLLFLVKLIIQLIFMCAYVNICKYLIYTLNDKNVTFYF